MNTALISNKDAKHIVAWLFGIMFFVMASFIGWYVYSVDARMSQIEQRCIAIEKSLNEFRVEMAEKNGLTWLDEDD